MIQPALDSKKSVAFLFAAAEQDDPPLCDAVFPRANPYLLLNSLKALQPTDKTPIQTNYPAS